MHSKRHNSHTWANTKKRRLPTFTSLPSFWKRVKKIDKPTLIKNTVLVGIAVMLLGSIFLLGAFAWVSRDLPDPNSLTIREVPQSTKIYDKTGEHLLYEIAGDEKRTLVTLDEIPEYLVWATITAEDRSFYEHKGIDFRGILRAIFVDVMTLSKTQGASTITQQLVKNAILSNEKTFTRKFKEILLAVALERRYTKDEIMQLYLNEIPYGSRNYGVQSAAKAYYDVNSNELTLAQAATLAALPQATTYYLNNPEQLKARKEWILGDMAKLGYITEAESQAAMQEDTSITAFYSDITAPHFVLWVKEQLEGIYGQKKVEQGGLTVITSINYEMQESAQDAIVTNKDARSSTYGFNNSGLVAIDPKNGHILAMVGSVDYFDDEIDGQVNVTLQPLQPGSSFKPIVYTAAFERGYAPNTILWDVETEFGTATGPYSPKNYNLREHGPLTVRSALQGSLNIPAVKMLYLVGVNKAASFAQRLGYTTLTDPSNYGLSMVLGGAEVKLLEHTSAYATFANEGIYHKPVAILKVENSQGEVLEQWEEKEGEKVLEQNIARMITDILSDDAARAPFFGSGSYLTLGGRPAAAKTGTTNDYKDAWTMGYTPQLVAGVWTGNTNGTAMNRGSGGSSVAAPIWNAFMRSALADMPTEHFNDPSIPKTGIAMLDGTIPKEEVIIDLASGKLATERTPEHLRETLVCGEYHTILHYIDPSDPTAGVVKEPVDGAYGRWESAVQSYISAYNASLSEEQLPLVSCEIPTEEDDVHTVQNEPKVRILSPSNGEVVGRTFEVKIRANAKRGIQRIEYQINGRVITQSTDTNDQNITLPSWVDVGQHTLTVVAYDDVDNKGSAEVLIDVAQGALSARVSITNPFNGQEIEKTTETYVVVVEIAESNIESLTLFSQNLWDGGIQTIGSVSSPSSITTLSWPLPSEGAYLLYGTALSQDGITDIKPVGVYIGEPEAVESSTHSFEYLITPVEEPEMVTE